MMTRNYTTESGENILGREKSSCTKFLKASKAHWNLSSNLYPPLFVKALGHPHNKYRNIF